MAAMDVFGFAILPASSLMKLRDTGHIQIMAGHGFLTTIGVGRRFTMAAGPTTMLTVGSGFRVTNGRLHGLAGAAAAITMDGRRYLLA